jgi:hypothetical protein
MNLAQIVQTMADAGCSGKQIAEFVSKIDAAKREKAAQKKRLQRANPTKSINVPRTDGDISVSVGDSAEASRACSNTNLPSGDISYIPPLPPKPEKAQSRQRGHRLPKTWQPAGEVIAFAKSLGFTDDLERRERAAFFDYWLAIPGSKGCKLDWDATYRNRLRDMAGRLKLKPAANVLPFSGAPPPSEQYSEAEKERRLKEWRERGFYEATK